MGIRQPRYYCADSVSQRHCQRRMAALPDNLASLLSNGMKFWCVVHLYLFINISMVVKCFNCRVIEKKGGENYHISKSGPFTLYLRFHSRQYGLSISRKALQHHLYQSFFLFQWSTSTCFAIFILYRISTPNS